MNIDLLAIILLLFLVPPFVTSMNIAWSEGLGLGLTNSWSCQIYLPNTVPMCTTYMSDYWWVFARPLAKERFSKQFESAIHTCMVWIPTAKEWRPYWPECREETWYEGYQIKLGECCHSFITHVSPPHTTHMHTSSSFDSSPNLWRENKITHYTYIMIGIVWCLPVTKCLWRPR